MVVTRWRSQISWFCTKALVECHWRSDLDESEGVKQAPAFKICVSVMLESTIHNSQWYSGRIIAHAINRPFSNFVGLIFMRFIFTLKWSSYRMPKCVQQYLLFLHGDLKNPITWLLGLTKSFKMTDGQKLQLLSPSNVSQLTTWCL